MFLRPFRVYTASMLDLAMMIEVCSRTISRSLDIPPDCLGFVERMGHSHHQPTVLKTLAALLQGSRSIWSIGYAKPFAVMN